MTSPDLITLFVRPLNQLGLRYMVTGAVAAVVYGEPRFTRDIDLVIELRPADASRVAAVFPAGEFYVPPLETIVEEAGRPERGHFNLIHHETALKADCYVAGRDPLSHWAMSRRVREDVGHVAVWIAPPEYVIVRKLEWFRDGGSNRHLDDIRAMLRISGTMLDRPALEDWIKRLGVDTEWASAMGDG